MVHLIDVSKYQPTVNWTKVAAVYQGAYCKASQQDYADPCWAKHRAGAQKAGLLVGPYCFLYPGKATAKQHYEAFKAAVLNTGGFADMLPPALDVEGTGDGDNALDGMSAADYRAMALEWIQRLHDDTGIKPFVYTYPWFNTQFGIGKAVGSRSVLWAASYRDLSKGKPVSFAGWDGWSLWQWGVSPGVDGIAGEVDRDVFNGTVAELQALVVKPQTTPVEVVDHATGKVIETLQVVRGGDHIADQGKVYVRQGA